MAGDHEGKRESLFSKVLTHALVTTTGILVTAYLTNMLKQQELDREVKEVRVESSKQSLDASEKAQERINELVAKYERLAEKYEQLLLKRGERLVESPPQERHQERRDLRVDGQWYTPDSTVMWEFDNGTVRITGVGPFMGIIDATGHYQINGDAISGTLQLRRMFYLPVNTQGYSVLDCPLAARGFWPLPPPVWGKAGMGGQRPHGLL